MNKFSAVIFFNFSKFLVIETPDLYPYPDPYLGPDSLEMPDPDPNSMNPDPQHCNHAIFKINLFWCDRTLRGQFFQRLIAHICSTAAFTDCRRKFPKESIEPDLNLTKKDRGGGGKFSSLSRIRHAMRM
jgi:hypothetical protein